MIGTSLSHYRVTARIGAGGMGEVYRAEDTNLGREVAIKVLPTEVAQDPDRLARFEREAHLLASLSHPHIAAIHGLEEADGQRFLVLELIEGEDLSERLSRGPVPVDETLDIARQVAEALEEAHARGVIHRDLKPANVKLTPEGKVKVLDFGLAKAYAGDGPLVGSGPDLSQSPTLARTGTQAGVILGTAAYMSPEQARGRDLDKRTDIWAFGCFVTELLTGRRTFGGESVTDVLASVVKDEPDFGTLPPDTPWRLRELLARCLVKNPQDRLRDIGDARVEVGRALADPEPLRPGTSTSDGKMGVARLAMALALGAVLASAAWWSAGSGRGTERAPLTRLSLEVEDGYRVRDLKISPDGRTIAYLGVERPGARDPGAALLVRPLNAEHAQVVAGSEGVTAFAFSPDSDALVFVAPIARESSRFQILKLPLGADTRPVAVSDWDASWQMDPVWLPDGDLVVSTQARPQAVVRIPLDGGTAHAAVPLKGELEGSMSFSAASPDGRVLAAFSTWENGYRQHTALVDPSDGQFGVVVENGLPSRPLSSGHLVFSRHASLLAAPFDSEAGRLAAGPVAVAGGLRSDVYSYVAPFDVSATGALVHLPGGQYGDKRRLAILGTDGWAPWSDDTLRINGGLNVSGDGRWLAMTVMNEGGVFEVWGSEVARPALRRLVALPNLDCASPVWSADASLLAVDCSAAGEADGIYVLEMDGTTEPTAILRRAAGEPGLVPVSVSPGADEIMVRRGGFPENVLLAVPLKGGNAGTPTVLLEGAATFSAALSEDGTKLVYASNETGRFEVFLRRRSGDGGLGPAVPVAPGNGPEWRIGPDGTERLFFATADEQIVSTVIAADLTATPARTHHDLAQHRNIVSRALLPDGRLLAVLQGEDEMPPDRIEVVLGFDSEVERLASSSR